jgi:hypothetical protein
MNTRNWASLACISMFCLAGCAGGSQQEQEQQLSWEEFRAQVYQEPDTGIFIVNGDEPILNETGLREFYDRMIDEQASAGEQEGLGQAQQPLIANYPGYLAVWSVPAALNITYCISGASFGGDYANVMTAMHTAAADWRATGASIQFIHSSMLDTNCNNSTGVVFNVRKADNPPPGSPAPPLARAFFPGATRYNSELLIWPGALGNISPLTLAGILRHELGHVLGFRHEHTRPEAGTCFEDNNWRSLTTYDSASVMHYPQCNGTNLTGDLVLTPTDAVGVRAQYPVVLLGNQSIGAGQSISSSDGRFSLVMQADGNLVHYWNGHGALWSTGTWGTQGKSAWMQYDGNFVLYTTATPTAGNYLWSSNTAGYPGAYLAIQNDGNLVVYNHIPGAIGFGPIWNSGTGGH